MSWQQLLTKVRDAYQNAPNPNQPIANTNYLAMLHAFRLLVPMATISGAYDTDFRRNLPGGGLSGLELPSLSQRIANAETFAKNNPLFPTAGEGIAENIRAICNLVTPSAADTILSPLQPVLQNILSGNL